MFIITDKRFTTLGNQIFEFMSGLYPNLTTTDIEVIHTDLTEDNVFGWTTENNHSCRGIALRGHRERIRQTKKL